MPYQKGRVPVLAAVITLVASAAPHAAEAEGAPASSLVLGPPLVAEARSTGREVAPTRARPEAREAPVVACSFRAPVCVHAAESTKPAATLWALRHAERALGVLRALGLPEPLADQGLGGGPDFDIYLVVGAPGLTTTTDLLPQGGGLDRQSAFAVMPPPKSPDACEAQADITRAIATAAALGLDAGAEASLLSMVASYVAATVATTTGCDLVELAAVDDFQRAPWRALTSGAPGRPDGALLFPWFLDDAYGRGAPGAVITALLAISAQRTKPGAFAWDNEPDLFDALRATMKDRGFTLDELLLDFSVARAFVGDRSDEAHLRGAGSLGVFGRVRFEWTVPLASLPRRLAPSAPIDPTGATYLWVDAAGGKLSDELTFIADWELPALFRWALIKVDLSGAEVGRVSVAGVYGDSHTERTVVGLEGLAGVLIVGVNAGSVDRAHPFDPDEMPLAPHGYTVTLAR
jgi:hypothetical protein